jgi:uncharacterized damage-inducible protein DinB
MQTNEILLDAFGRVKEIVHRTVEGLSDEQLAHRPSEDANSVAWLVWHLARVQDDHIADVAGTEQVWTKESWVDKFGLPFDVSATGYGQTSEEVGQVKASAELLAGYYDAVHAKTEEYIRGLEESDYAKIVDDSWDPPVTLAVRLVSILNDDTQHAGQAAYVRGLLQK